MKFWQAYNTNKFPKKNKNSSLFERTVTLRNIHCYMNMN